MYSSMPSSAETAFATPSASPVSIIGLIPSFFSWATASLDSGRRMSARIRRFPMLERQEEYMLAKRSREHGDRDAAHKLVTSHLRLVTKIARDYRRYGP